MTSPKPLPKPEEVSSDDVQLPSSTVDGYAVYGVREDGASDSDAPSSAEPSGVVSVPEFVEFSDAVLQQAAMQTVLLSFLLLAVLVSVGSSLWLSFSDKWRS